MFTAVKGTLDGYGYEQVTLAGAGHEACRRRDSTSITGRLKARRS